MNASEDELALFTRLIGHPVAAAQRGSKTYEQFTDADLGELKRLLEQNLRIPFLRYLIFLQGDADLRSAVSFVEEVLIRGMLLSVWLEQNRSHRMAHLVWRTSFFPVQPATPA